MNFEKKLSSYKETMKIIPNEQNIQETVKKSIDAFCLAEQEKSLNDWEFLWAQLKLIRKRWWFFQFLLLSALWLVLPSLHGEHLMQRTLGVMASLFVILIIPELWKNQTYQSMEIEVTSYYSLRQIYAARMLLFGVADVVLITFFCSSSSIAWDFSFSQLLIQFLFPMAVTSCICFGILCSKHPFGEAFAVMMCIAWSVIWWLVIMNERVYAAITFPLWIAFLVIALIFLVFAIYRTIYNCNNYWEVNVSGIDIK